MNSLKEAKRRGQADGYRTGWAHGYEQGCEKGRQEALSSRELIADLPLLELRVLFVKACGSPYASLNDGIADGLACTVREWRVIGSEEPVPEIAAMFRPDLVLVLDSAGSPFPVEQASRIRAEGIPIAVWFPDDPYHSDLTLALAPHYDYVFTIELSCVSFYRAAGCKEAHYLPFAANPNRIHSHKSDEPYLYDICFIGTAFWNRAVFFDQISGYLRNKRVFINGWFWDRMANYNEIAHHISGYWLPPEETVGYYSSSKIVINLHRAAQDEPDNSRRIPAASVNPRLFEIAACGTLQLTDEREQLSSIYVPGAELATFASPQELMEKMDYYLTHEEERCSTALRGLHRTLEDHTYRKRLVSLFAVTHPNRKL